MPACCSGYVSYIHHQVRLKWTEGDVQEVGHFVQLWSTMHLTVSRPRPPHTHLASVCQLWDPLASDADPLQVMDV